MDGHHQPKAVTAAAVAACIAAVVLLSACAKDNILPKTKLPQKPLAATKECRPLTELEEAACLKEAKEARTVCYKVQRSTAICKANQEFIDRLYRLRNNK